MEVPTANETVKIFPNLPYSYNTNTGIYVVEEPDLCQVSNYKATNC